MSELAPATAADYTIRRLTAEDAAGVNACVRAVYGNSYIHDELYHPERLLKMNETGELVSVVALDPQAKVVGHYALERPGLRPVAEGGEAMVLADHRHHQLMERMRAMLEQEAKRLDLQGLFGHAVTNHVFSQRSDERFGEHVCAISLGWSPQSFHNMAQELSQRMSDVLYFKFLRRPASSRAHLPERHRQMCEKLYGQLGLSLEPAASGPAGGASAIEVDYRRTLGRAVVHVRRIGPSTGDDLAQTHQDLLNRGAEAIFLELPLSQAGTPALSEAAEARGYFFNGLGPCFAADGDALRLQWLAGDLDTSQLQLESPLAHELLNYINQQRTPPRA